MPHRSWTLLGSRYVGDYRVVRLREDRYRFELSQREADFIVCESADWALTIPITSDGQVVFIRQYRHGQRQVVLEIPGGVLDEGESPEAAGVRELREETGYQPGRVSYLGRLMPNPALNSAWCHVVVAEDCRYVSAAQPDGLEHLEVELHPLDHVPEMIRSGELVHAQVIAAFALWQTLSNG